MTGQTERKRETGAEERSSVMDNGYLKDMKGERLNSRS